MRKLALLLFLSVACIARDNPFRSVENISQSTHKKIRDDSFHSTVFTLPDSARIIKNVEIYYQNIDGSVEKKSIKIDKNIDWHDKFMISRKDMETKVYAKKPANNTEVQKEQNLTEPSVQYQEYAFKNFISFKIDKKSIKVTTNDKLIRDFLVSKPYKVVLDFKRDAHFLTKIFDTHSAPFISIVLGNHDKYYRVAIELDGQYNYTLKKEEGDYIITLK